MLPNGLVKYEQEERRTKQGSNNFSRLLVIIGIVLLLNICSVSAVNSTDVTDLPPTQTLNVTTIPAIQTLNVTTMLPTQTQQVPTVTTTTSVAKKATTVSQAVKATAANSPQFKLRMDKEITQADKEAAAANYRKIREAYLTQGSLGTNIIMGDSISAAPPMDSAAAPPLDPGGVPHYFGPFPNWANSPMPKGRIASITVDSGGSGYSATPVVTVEDVYFTGSGATATATVTGGVITGITVTSPGTGYSAPVVIISDTTGDNAAATAILGGPFTGGIRKFVDTLPGLNAAGANNLGQYIPVAIPDTTTYPGSDYYEIELGEYSEKLHSDLPNTTLRGYRQTNTADPTISRFHNLGPLFVTTANRPVRIKFTNNLPVGAGGNLFVPVDKSLMGAGMGPLGMNVTPPYYTENRAEIHLHGGNTPWISDGTPHQWITPAGEYTAYPEGASVYNVPDMPDPGNGSVTLYYTNQQSARLMFYHDHSHGITTAQRVCRRSRCRTS